MIWFKNAMIYRLTKSLDWSPAQLQQQLQQCEFHPCAQSDMSKFGWTNPLRGSELLYFAVGKQILLLAHKEEKILPAQVVNRELEGRIAELEEKEQRKLKKTEKQALKDDVIAALLPRAFSKNRQTAIWIDSEADLIYVDSASSKQAEDILALLRKSLGSLPVVPLSFANDPTLVMSDWISNDHIPQWLTALEDAELCGSQDNAVIRCKRQSLESEEILSLLQAGKCITKLALEWDEHLSFVLNEDCSLKRLKFADQVREKNDDILKEDIAQRFDADFVLMTGILAKLTENLLHEFGGEKELL
ncbi:recombination-associated protein RdgC [Caviibacterium pharyngocola]|uniref:Recombination-associated protein RdgC n=1 Tax=Caviibacterium pharyngocola TaxID=28159 RepID=A0A2M8RVY6_9PAST|nr:recombination-associated protein RdgC [Caviibacterium pharyngocola]PJG83058.1 recombination-associated protein RdgC [Caviibacterium pharyngocola]